MRAWCAQRTTAQALEELSAAGIPAGPVHTLQQALDQAQAQAMDFFREVADYPGLPRPARVPDFPVRLSASGGGIERCPPSLGEHTDEILASLGYSREEIHALRADGVA
jgi:formyl-CoA transferase